MLTVYIKKSMHVYGIENGTIVQYFGLSSRCPHFISVFKSRTSSSHNFNMVLKIYIKLTLYIELYKYLNNYDCHKNFS